MSISLHRLRYFHTIADRGSFSAAARELGIAQPALSYHVAEIEKHLGTRLFERNNKGVTLTPAGRLLDECARSVIKRLQETEDEIRSTIHDPQGTVSMVLPVTMARQLVPKILGLMNEHHPRVRLQFYDAASVPAIKLLQSGQADLGLVPNAAQLADCDVKPVYRERLCLISRSLRKRRDNRPIRLCDISNRSLVLNNRSYDVRRRVEEAAANAGVQLTVRYEQASMEIIRSIVLAGLAATINQAAVFDSRTEWPQLDIQPVIDPPILRTHTIVRRLDQGASAAVAVAALALEQSIRELVDSGVLPGETVAS